MKRASAVALLLLSAAATSAVSAADLLSVYQDALANDPAIREADANRKAAREVRPQAEIELSVADAHRREIGNGDLVDVRSNGSSVPLRARLNRTLMAGVARVADEHAGDLHATVEVVKR